LPLDGRECTCDNHRTQRHTRRALLFVDDDRDLRELISDAATTSLGFEHCVLAGSFADVEHQRDDALACSLAIIDINLGWTSPSGVDVYNWLKREHFEGDVVFLTGHGEDDLRLKDATRIGGVRVFLKPVSMDVLAELTSEAFKSR
jgi:response regulator of citrate/malate metabolism